MGVDWELHGWDGRALAHLTLYKEKGSCYSSYMRNGNSSGEPWKGRKALTASSGPAEGAAPTAIKDVFPCATVPCLPCDLTIHAALAAIQLAAAPDQPKIVRPADPCRRSPLHMMRAAPVPCT